MIHYFSIKSKILTSYVLFFCLFMGFGFFIISVQFKNTLMHNITHEQEKSNRIILDLLKSTTSVSIKSHLRAIAEKNLEIITRIHERTLTGELTLEDAKKRAKEILFSQTIGKTGYIYCVDSQGNAVVHPKPGVEGKGFAHHLFVQTQMERKNGYLEYEWQNPSDNATQPKALYMTYFEPWDWIISVSSYRDEFLDLISVEDFKSDVLNLRFGKSGYSFIIDQLGNVIVHPELTGNLYDNPNKNIQYVASEMLRQKKGFLTYQWRNVSDNLPREKFVSFDYLPSYQWIIGSSSYTDEIFAPLKNMERLFLFFIGISFITAILMAIVMSKTITTPLAALIRKFEAGAIGDLSVRMAIQTNRADDEISRLAVSFNQFMGRLQKANETLLEEIENRKKAENELKLFKKVFENAGEGISITDADATIIAINPAFTRITGFENQDVVGKTNSILKSGVHDDQFYAQMWKTLSTQGQWSGEIWNRRKNGETFPELLSISVIKNADNVVGHYLSIFHDITEMKNKEREIEYLAYHDPLTTLPNRQLLIDRLNQLIPRAQRKSSEILIIFIDIDDFKKINDSLGHAAGDLMLKQVTSRLTDVVRDEDTVSRLGGDEFVVMATDIDTEGETLPLVNRLRSCFEAPFLLQEHEFHVTVSIGIATYPNDGSNAEELIKNADLAMFQSKTMGKDTVNLFSSEMERRVMKKVQLEAQMRQAMANDEFTVFFQPRIDAFTGKPVAMEALVRWITENGKMVFPGDFIPVAEESGLIIPLGEKILDMSCVKALQIMEKIQFKLTLSVNVSPRQFEADNFETVIENTLEQTGFPPDLLEIEITETLLMQGIDRNLDRLDFLSDLGIKLAIDDFGTGYSSMAYLKRLPVSVLKIDKSFIDNIPSDRENTTIVETIYLMAQKLNLSVVAEGVETHEQFTYLKTLGPMEIQGYFFSPPKPMNELLAFVHDQMAQLQS